jgi:hypothetical protein
MQKLFKVRRAFQLILVIAPLFLLASCASVQNEHSLNLIPGPKPGTVEADLNSAINLFRQGGYQAAADILRSLAAQESAQSRLEQVLIWLGRCEQCLTDPFKTRRLLAVAEADHELPG